MKATERLAQIVGVLIEDVKKRTTPENFARYENHYRESAARRAIGVYLDEQGEIEKRRVALWTALAAIGPGCGEMLLTPLLEQAGIDYRPMNGEQFEDVRAGILHSARKAGLV